MVAAELIRLIIPLTVPLLFPVWVNVSVKVPVVNSLTLPVVVTKLMGRLRPVKV